MSEAGRAGAGGAENPDLAGMHRQLVALVGRLEESVDRAPDAVAIAAISDRIQETNARATAVGRVLLAERTDEISRHARAFAEAIPELERELEQLDNLERAVSGVAALLGTVDEAVRVAGLVCR